MSKNLWYITGALVVITIFVIWLFVSQLRVASRIFYEAVPETSLVIIESGQDGLPWKKLVNQEGIWQTLSEIEQFNQIGHQISLLDSVINRKSGLKDKLKMSQTALVIHEIDGGFGFILISETATHLFDYDIVEMVSKQTGDDAAVLNRKYKGFKTGFVIDALSGLQYNYCLTDGLFIGSFSKQLLEKSLDQLDSKRSLLNDPEFAGMRNTAGQSVDGYVFMNTARFAGLISYFASEKYRGNIGKTIGNLGGWMALDMYLKPSELILNGYVDPQNSQTTILSNLSGQEPVPVTLFQVFPIDTRFLLHLGMSDFAMFHRKQWKPGDSILKNNSGNTDIGQILVDLVDNEIAFGLVGEGSEMDPVFVAKLKDSQLAAESLNQYASSIENNQKRIATEHGFIEHINVNNFVAAIFGHAAAGIDNTWYCFAGDNLIFANNHAVLERILRFYKAGRTLAAGENFSTFSNHISDHSNILLYVNTREGISHIERYLSEPLKSQWVANKKSIRSFEGLAIQFSSTNNLVYTNVYVKHNLDYKEESQIAWKVELNDLIVGKPFIVPDGSDRTNSVIVADTSGRLLKVSANGKIQWQLMLQEQLISDITVVDKYQSGELYYLLNTTNYIYLIESNGRTARNFPVRLSSQASSGLSLFDYDGFGDYRIMIHCVDRALHCFELSGRVVNEWEFPKLDEIAVKPAERLVAGGRDYIIMTSINGELRIVDRKGSTRISPKGNFNKALHSDFYVNRTNSKGIMLTTDEQGKLMYLNSNGLISRTDFGTYNQDHYFLYEDFTRNNSVDFVFIDQQKLIVYDRFRSVLYQQKFDNEISEKPFFVNLPDDRRYLVVATRGNQEIFLIAHDNRLNITTGQEKSNSFAIGSLNNNSEVNLITESGRTLLNYQVY